MLIATSLVPVEIFDLPGHSALWKHTSLIPLYAPALENSFVQAFFLSTSRTYGAVLGRVLGQSHPNSDPAYTCPEIAPINEKEKIKKQFLNLIYVFSVKRHMKANMESRSEI
jgi:hypothetical protein